MVKDLESRTRPVSSRETLARDSRQMHSASVYSQHYRKPQSFEANLSEQLAQQFLVTIVDRCLAGCMAMHACQIGPTDTTLPCLGSPQGACVVTRGELFGAGNLSASISPLLLKCVDGAITLSFCFGISGSQHLRPRW